MKVKYFRKYPESGEIYFYVRGIGIRELMRPCIVDRPRGTGDYLFMYFYDPVILDAGGEKKEFREYFIVWPPEAGQYFGNPEKTWNHSWIHCRGKLASKLLRHYSIPCNTAMPLSDAGIFEKYLSAIYHEITGNVRENQTIVENFFCNFIVELARAIHPPKNESQIPENILKSRALIESAYSSPISMARLAESAGLSSSHFRSEFQKYAGFSPKEYQVHLRMLDASMLLANNRLRVKEIAKQVGYEDIYHFSKLFKKYFGMSPQKMRKAKPAN